MYISSGQFTGSFSLKCWTCIYMYSGQFTVVSFSLKYWAFYIYRGQIFSGLSLLHGAFLYTVENFSVDFLFYMGSF